MTAKNKTSTLKQRVDSIYRRQIEIDRNIKRTMKTLADDFTRVIRQNDTLRGENETLKGMLRVREEALHPLVGLDAGQLREADTFMAQPVSPEYYAPTIHVYGYMGKRCIRCSRTKEAIDATGELCEGVPV